MDIDLQCECGCAVTVRNRQLSWVRCPDCGSRISVPRSATSKESRGDEWQDWGDDVVRKKSNSGAGLIVGFAVAVALVVGVAMAFFVTGVMKFDGEPPEPDDLAQHIEPEPPLKAKPARVFANSLDAQNAFPPRVDGPALEAFRIANQLKDYGRYAQAEAHYKRALEIEPNFPFAAYQLACNYCRWGKPDDGWNWFQRSVDMGLWSHPLIADDFEVNPLRKRPGFDDLVDRVKLRYENRANEVFLPPIVMRPEGDPPKEGWPLMLIMHGYGGTSTTWVDYIESWTRQGFIAVGVTGPIAMSDFWFRWPVDSIDKTHEYLQVVLQDANVIKDARQDAVFLMGYSQGAVHALQVIAKHPDKYSGVIAISPTGEPNNLDSMRLSRETPRSIVLISGQRDQPETHQAIQTVQRMCQQSGWWHERRFHTGGRHIPKNWHEIEPVIAKTLKRRLEVQQALRQ